MFTATLNDFEIFIMQNLANAVSNGVGGNRTELRVTDDEGINLRGFCGELAFCKIFNCYPDLSVMAQSCAQGTDRGDVKLNGFTIDVKTTKYPNGRLIARRHKKINGDFFALMVGDLPTFEFKGFMRQEELLRPERLVDFYGVPTFVAEQSELIGFAHNDLQMR